MRSGEEGAVIQASSTWIETVLSFWRNAKSMQPASIQLSTVAGKCTSQAALKFEDAKDVRQRRELSYLQWLQYFER